MARINTKADLISYLKSQLGAPTIKIEVSDDQIGQIIDDAVTKFTEYAYGTLEATIIMDIDGAGTYEVPDTITNILQLSKGGGYGTGSFAAKYGSAMVPDIWSEQFFSGTSATSGIMTNIMSISATQSILDKYFGDDINYNFNPYKKVIQIFENYKGTLLLNYQYEYLADEDGDFIYNHEWIKGYAKARVKELWGTVTGKFSQSLVGGATINYDRMISEAQQEIEYYNEQLITKWCDPAPVLIG